MLADETTKFIKRCPIINFTHLILGRGHRQWLSYPSLGGQAQAGVCPSYWAGTREVYFKKTTSGFNLVKLIWDTQDGYSFWFEQQGNAGNDSPLPG